MSELANDQVETFNLMIKKLQHDPDKFERMFAAQYLARYNFSEIKDYLIKALEDPDPEVVLLVRKLLEKGNKS
ncbi:MAG: HEAT repeat domain-containing protein [Candidatus Heimdallarchaeota archaeon]|nr:MAG: HEAT repeat domain-containing protein [Candidatus Heimdallarchaeota archaeon]